MMDLREQIRLAIGGALAAQEGSDGAAGAVMEVLAKQEPFAADSDVFRSAFEAALKAGNWPATRQGDGYRSPSTQIAWRIAFSTVNRLKLYLAPGAQAQPAPSDEYVGWYCAHCERGVDASEVTYHEQHQACGRVITDDRPPRASGSVPEGVSFIDTSQLEGVVSTEIVHSYPSSSGWLRAIDEALVVTHLGVANASDTYEQAKAKLDNLIKFHVDVAIDPAVNGGYKLMPIEPTQEMLDAGEDTFVPTYTGTPASSPIAVYRAMLAAAPEAKPCPLSCPATLSPTPRTS